MRALRLALAGAAVLALAACAPAASSTSGAGSAPPSATPAPPPPSATPTPTPTEEPDPLAGLTLAERVGQLFIVGTPVDEIAPETRDAVAARHAGGVFLHGRSTRGVEATAALVAELRAEAPAGAAPLWVATDQEGGTVQVLRGPGFDEVPAAITQAQAGPETIRADAERWGDQLAAAGVTLNLAPVADIVTDAASAPGNAPIGALGREYGYDADAVAAGAGAFADGQRAGGVLPTFKHFPGLGRVAGNTDYSADVRDTEVDAAAPDVAVYRDLLEGGPAMVMLSSAVYERLDPSQPAMFSPRIATDLLRDEAGFTGVAITDDVSAVAQLQDVPPGERAVRAIEAGIDIVLVSAAPGVYPEMYDAVHERAASDPAFAERVDEAATRVLEAKEQGPGGD